MASSCCFQIECPNRRLLFYVLCLTFAASTSYFISSAFNIAETAISNFLTGSNTTSTSSQKSSVQWSIAQSLELVGAAVGILFFVQSSIDHFGRRTTVFIQLVCGCVSYLIQGLAKYAMAPVMLYMGRFIQGLFITTMCVTLPVFISEISPKEHRGFLSSSLTFINKGFYALGCVAGMPYLLGNTNWPWIPFIAAIATFLFTLSLIPIPESPKFLYLARNRLDRAQRSLIFYQSKKADPVESLKEWDAEGTDVSFKASFLPKYGSLFRQKRLRGSFWLCLFVVLGWSATAGTPMGSISMSLLETMGLAKLDATIVSIIMFLVAGVTSAVASKLIDSWGRRPVGLISSALVIFFWLLLCLLNFLKGTSTTTSKTVLPLLSAIAVVCLRGSSAGVAVLFFTTIPESYPFALRSQAKAFFTFVSYLIDSIVTMTLLQVIHAVGPPTYLLMAVWQFICFIYLFFHLRETKKMPVHEVLNSVNRKFRKENMNGVIQNGYLNEETPLLKPSDEINIF